MQCASIHQNFYNFCNPVDCIKCCTRHTKCIKPQSHQSDWPEWLREWEHFARSLAGVRYRWFVRRHLWSNLTNIFMSIAICLDLFTFHIEGIKTSSSFPEKRSASFSATKCLSLEERMGRFTIIPYIRSGGSLTLGSSAVIGIPLMGNEVKKSWCEYEAPAVS